MEDFKFDKSRVVSFTDAIFSIAMTLLVLEITIPTIDLVEEYGTLLILETLLPSFIGLVVSFFVTALYWIAHLRIMKYVTSIDNKLLWLNIFLLLFIVLMPFSTAFYVSGYNFNGPFIFYCFNLSAIGLFNFLIVNYVVKTEKQGSGLNPNLSKKLKLRALNPLVVWLLAALVALVLPMVARFVFLLIFVFQILINFYFKKKKVL